MQSDFLKPSIKSLAPKWMVQAVKLLPLYLRGTWFESRPGYQFYWLKSRFLSFIQGLIWGEESSLLRCDTLGMTSNPRCYESVADTALRTSECRRFVTYLRETTAASFHRFASWRVPSALVDKRSKLIWTALLRHIITDTQPGVGRLLCKNHNVFGNVWLLMYRVIKKSLCTRWLQCRKLQVVFKVSPASLQTFIDTLYCVLEDRVQYSTVHIPNVFCDGRLQLISCVRIVVYCNRQMHRDFLITLYKCMKCNVFSNPIYLSSVARIVCYETSAAELLFQIWQNSLHPTAPLWIRAHCLRVR